MAVDAMVDSGGLDGGPEPEMPEPETPEPEMPEPEAPEPEMPEPEAPEPEMPEPEMPEPEAPEPEAPEPAPDGTVATVVVTAQPQVPSASLDVLVQLPAELPQGEGCGVVAVDPDDPPAPLAEQFDAGAITIDGLAGGPYTANFAGDRYQVPAIDNGGFAGGAQLSATSTGGALPAFDLSLAAPTDVQVSAPSQLATVDNGEDLTIQWNAGDGDAMIITLFPTEPFSVDPAEGEWIFCGAPDTGSFTVSGDDIARLVTGINPLGQGVLIAVTRTKSVTQPAGTGSAMLTATTSFGVPITVR